MDLSLIHIFLAMENDQVLGRIEYHFYGCMQDGYRMAYEMCIRDRIPTTSSGARTSTVQPSEWQKQKKELI